MICTREGCGRAATLAPKICVPALGRPISAGRPIETILTLAVCGPCLGRLTAADFIAGGDRGRDTLRQALAMLSGGRFLPDFDRAWVEPVDLASAEWAAVLQAKAGR